MTSKLTRERLEKIKSWRETYGAGSNVMLPAEEAEELARIALAAMDSEPVATLDVQSRRPDGNKFALVFSSAAHKLPDDVYFLYRHAQPAPVVPEKCPAEIRDLIDSHSDALFNDDDAQEIWNACRAAMLAPAPQSPGSEPATVPGKWIPVSERMPDDDDFVYIWPRPDFGVELHVGQYCECSPKGDGWYAQVYEQNYGIEWHPITVTYWMPLPSAPQEVMKDEANNLSPK